MNSINQRETGVLVIGGGLAGCWAALRAREMGQQVILVEKAKVAKSGASTFTNNMLAPVTSREKPSWHQEFVELGEYLNDQEWVDLLLTEQGERVNQLAEWGVPFIRNDNGSLRTTVGRGHRSSRIVLMNGHKLMAVMRQRLLETGVELVERTAIVDLLTDDGQHPTGGRVLGALGLNTRTGELTAFQANAVVVTTGQISTKLRAHFVNNLTGDGPAMAYRAGAQLVNMEFCTSGNVSYYQRRFHSGGQSLLQGMGARFVNSRGERFMEKYNSQQLAERSHLCYLVHAFAKEAMEGRGPVQWDMSAFSEDDINTIRKLLPTTLRPFDEAGIDVRTTLIECTPVVGLTSACGEGGIRINTSCATTLPGLYAAGATCWNPAHGTYTVGGVNLAFCNVGGYRAGENAALFAREQGLSSWRPEQLEELVGVIRGFNQPREAALTPDDLTRTLQQLVIPARYSLFKNSRRIDEVKCKLTELEQDLDRVQGTIPHELVKALEARNLVLLGRLVYEAAAARLESRSWHYREEYPLRDDGDWIKWITLRRDNGAPIVELVDIPLERYPVKPLAVKRPHPVQLSSQLL